MADRETEVLAKIASGVSRRSNAGAWDRLARRRSVPQPRFPLRARRFGQRRPGDRLDSGADPRSRTTAAPGRRRARLSQDATARANMCSTTAGPRRGSGPAGNIIPSCRSRCRSRRCRARGCSASRPQQLLAAIEAVTVQNGLSSAHITFIDEAGAAECERRGWLIRHGIQYHWFNRGYASFDDFLGALSSRKRKTIRKERAAALRGARDPRSARRRDRPRRVGRDVGLLPGHRLAQMGPALSHARVLRPRRRADGRPAAAVPRLPRRAADRRRAQLRRAGHALRPLLGHASTKCRSSISSSAITRRSNGRSSMAWRRSRPARRASTRSRAAMSR